jgi:YidC/Oxa1 family membrane protein insertase
MSFLEKLTRGVTFKGLGLWGWFGIPFQIILNAFCILCADNYSVAIFVFTVFINVCLFPLNIKQQKTMAEQQRLKPKLDKLKEKCGDDKIKYQNAMTELYQQEGISPMGGCLPMIIRLVILMGVYGAVTNMGSASGIDMTLFGINLTETPHFSTDIINDFQIIWILPILSFATSMLSSVISTKLSQASNPQAATGSMKSIMLLMPLMSLYIAFQVPGAVIFYWICSNVVNTVIQVIVTKLYSAEKLSTIEIAKCGAARRKKESERV